MISKLSYFNFFPLEKGLELLSELVKICISMRNRFEYIYLFISGHFLKNRFSLVFWFFFNCQVLSFHPSLLLSVTWVKTCCIYLFQVPKYFKLGFFFSYFLAFPALRFQNLFIAQWQLDKIEGKKLIKFY